MTRAIPEAVNPLWVTLFGYHGDFYWNRPGRGYCAINAVLGGVLFHNCDVIGGSSGGPLWRSPNSWTANVVGVQSAHGGHASCAGNTGNTAASGLYYAFAPDNAGGLAAAHTSNGRTTVYATDKDWPVVARREKATTSVGSDWTPWALDSDFSGGRKLAAVNLANNNQQVWVVDANGTLRTKWQNCTDSCWTGWSIHSTPVFVADVAATGDNNVVTHLFILGTDGSIRASHKTGGAGSAWSSWTTIGTQPGASSLAAVQFSGIQQIFVGHATGASTAWGGNGSYTGLNDFGGAGGNRAIAAGRLLDGRVNVVGVLTSGPFANRVVHRIRAADGSAWSAWTLMPEPNPTNTNGFVSIASGQLIDGRQQLFAVADNGEIYSSFDFGSGTFSSWTRFYK